MTTIDPSDDPFLAHLEREPMTGAGVRVIVITQPEFHDGHAVAESIENLFKDSDREVESVVIPVTSEGLARAIEHGLEGATLPLVLVTSAQQAWTKPHLEPLLKAIDACDHVFGRRPRSTLRSDFVARIVRRLIFAVPLRDVHSPCRLHRLEKLAAIPLQSESSFIDTEILAKATFLGHLIDEVPVPRLDGWLRSRGAWKDWNRVLSHPRFAREACRAEEIEGDHPQQTNDDLASEDCPRQEAVDDSGHSDWRITDANDASSERMDLNEAPSTGG